MYKGHGGNAKRRQVCAIVGVKAEVMRKGKTERLEKRHEVVCICAVTSPKDLVVLVIIILIPVVLFAWFGMSSFVCE